MNLSDVRKYKTGWKKLFRVGRGIGTGLGKNCGKGMVGQNKRSGERILPYFEGGQMPLIRKTPKRGFNNDGFAQKVGEVNLDQISKYFKDGETVTPEELSKRDVIKHRFDIVKVLGDGDVKVKVTVNAHLFSESAKKKLEAGGCTMNALSRLSPKLKFETVTISQLEKKFNAGDKVNPDTLKTAGLVKGEAKIKIESPGVLTKKLVVHAHEFSGKAVAKIRRAKGRAVVIREKATAKK